MFIKDFYPDNGPSELNACKNFKDRFDNDESVIIYEENENSKKFEDVFLTNEEINENGGIKKLTFKSVKNMMKSFLNKMINFFKRSSKRVFIKLHQFFGCSHLMAVRYYIFSINICKFESKQCESLEYFKANNCSQQLTDEENVNIPRMGYHADRSDTKYKISRNKFFVMTHQKIPFCMDPISRNNTINIQILSEFSEKN
jgi:hypothetical protein